MVTPRLYDHLLQEHFARNRQMDADYFASPGHPLVVPARTLLSQLL